MIQKRQVRKARKAKQLAQARVDTLLREARLRSENTPQSEDSREQDDDNPK